MGYYQEIINAKRERRNTFNFFSRKKAIEAIREGKVRLLSGSPKTDREIVIAYPEGHPYAGKKSVWTLLEG
jgi:hypothetical protein